MINNEIWEKHTTQQYGGQEKLEQEIVSQKKKMEKKNKSDTLKKKKDAWQLSDTREGSWVHQRRSTDI